MTFTTLHSATPTPTGIAQQPTVDPVLQQQHLQQLQQLQQQELLPADVVSTIIGLAERHGPAILERIFRLFQSQPHLMQAGLQPYGVSQPIVPWAQQPMPYGMQPYGVPGMGQDLLPADVVSTIIGLGVRHGPAIIKRIFDLFQSQFPAQPMFQPQFPTQPMSVPQPVGAFV